MKLTFPRRRTLVTIAVAAACGAGVALAITLPPLISANRGLSEAEQNLELTGQNLAATLERAVSAESKALDAQAGALRSMNELAAREAAVEAREQAVSATEQAIKESSFSGGIYVVGRDVAAGTYRTGELRDTCYYVWKTGTGADADIVDNNIVQEGTATITLTDGEVFESNRCGTWTKVG